MAQGQLVLVATPIGNLGDFSTRAEQALRDADFIAAEDTRVTIKLLNRFEIKKPMISYFEHNKKLRGEEIVRRIEAGETCALVTDAGMPAISDPGEDLVALCADNGIKVTIVPGPCAVVSALAVSGLPTGRFSFEGFLSVNKKSRREHLQSVREDQRTLIFYEAPHKLRTTLDDLLAGLGDRRIALVREMTKMHEEVVRTTISKAVEFYAQNTPKGEFVLVVEGMIRQETEDGEENRIEQAAQLVRELVGEGMSHSEAVKTASARLGVRKSELYHTTLGNENFQDIEG
ncbi:MAG TPA: 16S rRNA (cytidine(1402)-2'-O)-methyltransferase [Clostridia bacterium]|nr:16S rRNA (cytidine(1402)-2'-O)-methyltransferase [Clostridia bacterium]